MIDQQTLIDSIKKQLHTWLNTPSLQDPFAPDVQEHVSQILQPLTNTTKAERKDLFDFVYLNALPAGIPKDHWETVEWVVESIIYRNDSEALIKDHPKGINLIFQ